MIKFDEETLLVMDVRLALLKYWCIENNWSSFDFTQDGQFYAVPPNSYSPILIPKEVLDKNEQLIDIKLREIRFLKRESQERVNVALGWSVVCICLLFLKYLITNFVNNHLINYINASIVFAIVLSLYYGLSSVLSYYEYRRNKKNLSKIPEVVSALIGQIN